MVYGRVSTSNGQVKRRGKKVWALLLALAGMVGVSNTARADDFFDWLGEIQTPNTPPYVTAPTLDNTTVTQVANFLATEPAGTTLAVKVRAGVTLTPTTIAAIYNNFNIKYTFIDYEGATAPADTATLVNQIKASTVTGPQVVANNSFVGNFQIATINTDSTHPNSVTYTSGNSNAEPYFTATDFRNSGVNMSNESLYPGDASFRNPINGSNTATNGSNAPTGPGHTNAILSSLFTLPITRMTNASINSGGGIAHIPYVARFNNEDNAPFSNATLGGKPVFDTSAGANPAWTNNTINTAGQLLSRDDFEALILHYRMRGATSYQLLDPGVVGYTQAQEEGDALAGWNESLVANVLAGTNGRPAALGTTIKVDGTTKTFENAGMAYSAVTNDNPTGTQLALLISNMDSANHLVSFNTSINGATLSFTSGVLAGGSHTILRFTKSGGLWTPVDSTTLFAGDPAAMTSRDGVGIPEPTCLSLLGLGAFGILGRRRRNA